MLGSAGSFVFAPRGLPHTFTVDTEPTRVLVFASPVGFEEFAVELGQRSGTASSSWDHHTE